MDILSLVKDQLTEKAVEKISGFLGESSEGTSSAIGAALPMILGGVMQKGSSTSGISDLMNLFKNDGHDGDDVVDHVTGLLDKDNLSGLLGSGSGILSMLFGDKVGGITNLISSVSGLKSSSAGSLISMAAPILMGVLGKKVTSEGLGVSSLASLLMSQKDAVKAALPAGADAFIDVNKLGSMPDLSAAAAPLTGAGADVAEAATSSFNWRPLVLFAALGLGAFYYFKSCRNIESRAETVVTDTTAVAGASADGSVDKKLSTGVELNFGTESIENEVISFIEDTNKMVDKTTWFNFRGLQFDTGKADIKPESMKEVDNIAEIMKAYPNVNMKIGGYTDNVGKEASNQKLSAARAGSVAAALVAKGIDAARLETEGYGSQFPAASNDTEEGRAQNRRIAVRVTKK